MKMAFYAGASGIMAQQEAMDNIGHNIANVNTTGYLESQLSFASLLNTEMYANTPTDPLGGNGVKTVDMGLTNKGGSYRNTESPYDFAIVGEGFFAVDAGGVIEYTLDGTFDASIEGDLAYLVTTDGAYVLNDNFERIELQWDESKGRYAYESLTEQIGVFQFFNPTRLTPLQSNRYVSNELSGLPIVATEGSAEVRSSMLRNSSIEIEAAMADMIVSQRSYQLSARVVQTADENEQTINSLRR